MVPVSPHTRYENDIKRHVTGELRSARPLVIFLRVFEFVRSFMGQVRLTTFINLFPEKDRFIRIFATVVPCA